MSVINSIILIQQRPWKLHMISHASVSLHRRTIHQILGRRQRTTEQTEAEKLRKRKKMKRTGKSLVNLSKVLYSVKQINSSPVIRPLSTKTTTPTEETQQRVPSKPEKDSFILENFKLRKLKGSAKTNNPENKPSPPQPEQQQLSNIASEREKSSGSNAEVVSSFQELGLKAEMIKAVEKMGLFVPSEIQCVGIPAVLNGKSVVLSSGSGSGRTLAYLLPLVQVFSYFLLVLNFQNKSHRVCLRCCDFLY